MICYFLRSQKRVYDVSSNPAYDSSPANQGTSKVCKCKFIQYLYSVY